MTTEEWALEDMEPIDRFAEGMGELLSDFEADLMAEERARIWAGVNQLFDGKDQEEMRSALVDLIWAKP